MHDTVRPFCMGTDPDLSMPPPKLGYTTVSGTKYYCNIIMEKSTREVRDSRADRGRLEENEGGGVCPDLPEKSRISLV